MGRRIAAMFAALGLTLLLVSPALAGTPFHQAGDLPIDWNDAGSQGDEEECAGAQVAPGQVLWHFILNDSDSNDPTMTATFADASGNVTNMPPTKFSPMNDTAGHWTVHWDIYTSQTSLTGASTSGTGNNFNLSHICPGSPPPDVPEAPASILLLGAGAVALFGFFRMRQRRNGAIA